MNIIQTSFAGLFVLETVNFQDDRGSFQKLFNFDFFRDNQLDMDFKELYYSVSQKNVIRGMHFQMPPMDHTKVVYVSRGNILDVVLDLRKQSETYGKTFSIELNDHNAKYLYIPKGFAHGFLSLQDDTIVNYVQTSCYSKEHDSGIKWDSFGFDWKLSNPIISERDSNFQTLDNYSSPF